jgi:hypothetical protein
MAVYFAATGCNSMPTPHPKPFLVSADLLAIPGNDRSRSRKTGSSIRRDKTEPTMTHVNIEVVNKTGLLQCRDLQVAQA